MRPSAETIEQRKAWAFVRKAEHQYSRELRSVAAQVGSIVSGLAGASVHTISSTLARYAEILQPWARAVAGRMIMDVSRRDKMAWNKFALNMSSSLKEEVKNAPTGEVFRALMQGQVELITSLPLEAAQRVHQLVLKGQETAGRASEVAKEIQRTGEVTKSRANLIARTETSRAASSLLQARATYVGSEGYIWRTSEDSDVRPSHKKMDGKFVRWDEPPTLDNLTGHAGALPNCRCWPEPVIPSQ